MFSIKLYLGSRNGLSLILNVEQYEYMRGPQDDAGIKVRENLLGHLRSLSIFKNFFFSLKHM